ncbi:TrmB family transcriptional regulator sugar-binding domain-containing protein [Natronomonas sp. EA1]|uniref:TrmB family transcriptional regulator sugar-binding domain-containing protein n=1 Tax=Natronomonas sp. EA1 TaxID=3421655 RepID=UPI003EBDB072
MEKAELAATLETAGLPPYQAAAYVALLDLGAASATAIAEASEVPKPRIYDVLEGLESHGYIETYETDSLHARAHSPAAVLEDLRDRANQFETAAEEVEDRWEQPKLESNRTSIVTRFQTVLERARTFIEDAEYQIQLSVTPEDFEALRPQLVDAHQRGVSTRVSVHTDGDTEPLAPEAFEGATLEVRHRALPAPFVALVDREKTCFSHHPDSHEQYGVLVNDRTHTFVFHWYFLTCLWENWPTVYSDYGDSFPVTYVDVRQCVRDLKSLVDEGATPRVHIEGFEVNSGDDVSVRGTLDRAQFSGVPESQDPVERLSGQVTLTVTTDEGETITVGGWGAMLEDVEATRVTVLSVPTTDATAESDLFKRP